MLWALDCQENKKEKRREREREREREIRMNFGEEKLPANSTRMSTKKQAQKNDALQGKRKCNKELEVMPE